MRSTYRLKLIGKIVDSTRPGFPTLMKDKEGTIFLVASPRKGFYEMTCLYSPAAKYYTGHQYFSKNTKGYEEMPEGFFIEIERHDHT